MIRTLHWPVPAGRRLALAAAAAIVAVAAGTGTPAQAAVGWGIQSTPSPNQLNELIAVSCFSATACTAVGDDQNSSSSAALAERWNGSSWALQSAVNPPGDTSVSLREVSCPSATYCVAVGSNGGGTTSTAVAESWNGTSWTVMSPASPAGAVLSGVSCTSTTNCWAVGWATGISIAEHWNGSTWTGQTLSAVRGSLLRSVSCVSASDCVALGSPTYHWNGSTWTTQPAPTTVAYAISCTAANFCEAVGYFGSDAAAQSWNGSTWTAQTFPSPPESTLFGVSCVSATSCVAVGYTVTSTVDYTLADQWNGSTWTAMSTPNPSGAEAALFQGVSCPSTTDCTAAGDWYATSPALAQTLAEQWTG